MRVRRKLSLGETDDEMDARLGPELAAAVRSDRRKKFIAHELVLLENERQRQTETARYEALDQSEMGARRRRNVEEGLAGSEGIWEYNGQTIMRMVSTGHDAFQAVLSVWEAGHFSIPAHEVVHAFVQVRLGTLPEDIIRANPYEPTSGLWLPDMENFTFVNPRRDSVRIGSAAIHVHHGDIVTCRLRETVVYSEGRATISLGRNGVLATLS